MRSALVALIVACAPTAAPPKPDACAIARAPAGGPLQAEVEAATTPLAVARLRVDEGRRTSDDGFYALAEQALRCAAASAPADPELPLWTAHVAIQLHRFDEVEAALGPNPNDPVAWTLLSDAAMERGDLDAAEMWLERVLAVRPTLASMDRASHLAWLRADLDAAVMWSERAVSAGSPADPAAFAWALVQAAELSITRGADPLEAGRALLIAPDFAPAHLLLGRWMLANGDTERGVMHLRQAGPTFAAARALATVDPTVDPATHQSQDPRGYATWIACREPAVANAILADELLHRRDAHTRMAAAYAAHCAGNPAAADETRALVAAGTLDADVLAMAAITLNDPSLAARALAGPGNVSPDFVPALRAIPSAD
jgi:hypothetical protein